MKNQTRLRTAILPVAGEGTRLLPATKAVPKELLPVFDTPLLQFAIDEIAAAGIERLVVVSHPAKTALERYFDEDEDLAQRLRRKGKDGLAEAVERAGACPEIEVRFTWQHRPLGLGHAVRCAADHVLDGPVAVVLPDDLIAPGPCLAEMARAFDPGRAEMMIAAMKVRPVDISRYGAFEVTAQKGRVLSTAGIVEKPAPHEAPSPYAAVGRYILPPEIFEALARTDPGRDGEVQLTDAIDALVETHGLEGFLFEGQRFDCGCHEGLLAASNWRRSARLATGINGRAPAHRAGLVPPRGPGGAAVPAAKSS